MIYTTLFAIGVLGILILALLGAGHGSGHSGGHHAIDLHGDHQGIDLHAQHHGVDLHASHHGVEAQAGHHGASAIHHSGPGHYGGHDQHEGGAKSSSPLWSLLSPLSLFSICLGAGATGLLLRPVGLQAPVVAAAAAAGAAIFYGLIVRPLWALIFNFASKPAQMLDASVAKTAEVVTPFDPSGRGIVCVEVDGQLVRVLATLESDDRAAHLAFHPGDRVYITAIDGKSNTCHVTRLA